MDINERKEKNKKAIAAALDYARELTRGDYVYKWYGKSDHACPICHPETDQKGFNCIGFVTASFAHGAGDPYMLRNCQADNGSGLGRDLPLTLVNQRIWRRHNGPDWDIIKYGPKNGPSMPSSMLQPGDVILGYSKWGRYLHSMIYLGNDQIIESAILYELEDQVDVRDYQVNAERYHLTRAFRYTGTGKF